MSELTPMESTRYECIYCGADVAGGLNGHICDEREWMQFAEDRAKLLDRATEANKKFYNDNHVLTCRVDEYTNEIKRAQSQILVRDKNYSIVKRMVRERDKRIAELEFKLATMEAAK